MYYSKSGMPEENELVLCTVTNVQYNSVFCKLDEYGKSGMIHISEVSPGRIRNIRDYVQVGKKVVCKILRIDEEKGHIDLSLRRVTENQRREKNAEIKQEQKAEKLIEHYAKTELKEDAKKVYSAIAQPILEHYEYVYQAFDDIVAEETTLVDLGVPPAYAKRFEEIIKEKIPPRTVSIKGVLKIHTYHENGVEAVKEALIAARSVDDKRVNVSYLGNGRYRLLITADDYEAAEKLLSNATQAAEKIIDIKGPGEAVFARE